MSKGIILVDIPERCDGCEMCGTLIGKVICVAMIKRIHDINARPEWCPIKPLPKKINPYDFCDNRTCTANERGWNACIDSILEGGTR